MSAGPAQVRIKRKRDEAAPTALILKPPKRVFTDEDAASAKAVLPVQYVRVVDDDSTESVRDAFSQAKVAERQRDVLEKQAKEKARPDSRGKRRVFYLTRPSGVTKAVRKGHIKAQRIDVATFEETKEKAAGPHKAAHDQSIATTAPSQSHAQQLKRPGRGAAVVNNRAAPAQAQAPETAQERKRMESVADSLYKFALGELKDLPNPKITALRKYTDRRRNIDRPVAAHTEPRIWDDEEMDLDSDGEYVYDTYVLASTPPHLVDLEAHSELGDVGYLIITDEDQPIWETYIEDMPSDKDWDTDDEDENAEDYYGADYPEDELASDDEHGRNAYGYRANGASDDEEWDGDTGAYSDDDEYERTMNPWRLKTPAQFAAHLDPLNDGDA